MDKAMNVNCAGRVLACGRYCNHVQNGCSEWISENCVAFAKHGNYKQIKWIENASNCGFEFIGLVTVTKRKSKPAQKENKKT